MGKEVNINLGQQPKEKGSSCFDGVCPPNPLHILESLEPAIPMLLGAMLTYMKMDQFQRPLANTAMQMIEGLAPQIEKNATQVGSVINSLSEATHNVAAKMTKHDYDFTKEDKVHLMKMLIDEDNYLDSYDSVIDFLKHQSPGFVKALYKTMMANAKEGSEHIKHAKSKEGQAMIEKVGDNRPKAVSDRFNDLHDNILDSHIAKAKKGLELSAVGLEGKGLFKSADAADAIKSSTGIDTDKPSEELKENTARLNRQATQDEEIAKKSLKQSVEGDEKGAKETLDKAAEEKKSIEDKPTDEDITTAGQQITTNSASANATLASQQARRAEAKSEEAKAKVAAAKKKLDDAQAKLNTATSVKETATKAVENKDNMDPKLRKDLEAKLRTAVEAEGNADEKVKKLTTTLQEAKAATAAAEAKAAAAAAEANAAAAAAEAKAAAPPPPPKDE